MRYAIIWKLPYLMYRVFRVLFLCGWCYMIHSWGSWGTHESYLYEKVFIWYKCRKCGLEWGRR